MGKVLKITVCVGLILVFFGGVVRSNKRISLNDLELSNKINRELWMARIDLRLINLEVEDLKLILDEI